MAVMFYRALIVMTEGAGFADPYGAVFPNLPGCLSVGTSPAEAELTAADAPALHSAKMFKDGLALPPLSGFGRVAKLGEESSRRCRRNACSSYPIPRLINRVRTAAIGTVEAEWRLLLHQG